MTGSLSSWRCNVLFFYYVGMIDSAIVLATDDGTFCRKTPSRWSHTYYAEGNCDVRMVCARALPIRYVLWYLGAVYNSLLSQLSNIAMSFIRILSVRERYFSIIIGLLIPNDTSVYHGR